MQTFLPYSSFVDSAGILDYKRLGKQRVEVKQLLLALGKPVGEHLPKPTNSGWTNHPAVRMWRGYEAGLALYGIAICKEWRASGYNDTLLPQFEAIANYAKIVLPPWLGMPEFHQAHQSNLKRKDPVFYAHFNVPNNLEYIWPC